jgi:hypothetical protein
MYGAADAAGVGVGVGDGDGVEPPLMPPLMPPPGPLLMPPPPIPSLQAGDAIADAASKAITAVNASLLNCFKIDAPSIIKR